MFLVHFSDLFVLLRHPLNVTPQSSTLETRDSMYMLRLMSVTQFFCFTSLTPTTDWMSPFEQPKHFKFNSPKPTLHYLDLSILHDAQRFLKLMSTTTSLLSFREKSPAHLPWLTSPLCLSIPVWILISTGTTCSALELH